MAIVVAFIIPARIAVADSQVMFAVGGSFDGRIAPRELLAEVGPALRFRAGIGVEPRASSSTQLSFFAEYASQRTVFRTATTGEPRPARRHDAGLGFGVLRDIGPISAGGELVAWMRIGSDGSIINGWDLGPVVAVELGDHLVLSTLAAVSFNPGPSRGALRTDLLALRFAGFAGVTF